MARADGHNLRMSTNDGGDASLETLDEQGGVVHGIASCTVPNAQPASSLTSPQSATRTISGLMRAPNSVAIRLKRAREHAGYNTAADFARAWNLNLTTYYHHENGRRDIKPDIAAHYAAILKLPAGMLLYGERLQSIVQVPIVGNITADGKVAAMHAQDSFAKSVTMPDPDGLVGHVVFGNDLYPAYRDGDVVFHRALDGTQFNLDSLHGLECVVALADGSTLLRQVTVQRDGRATLVAYHAPPLIDQIVVAAAPVEIVQRNVPYRVHD